MNSPTADAGDRTARHLTPQDLAGLRAALHEQLRFHRRRPAGDGPAAAAPAGMVLADVEAALRRMDEGRYGVCHLCRLPVDRKRLRVVPQARYCAPCQRLRATLHRPGAGEAAGPRCTGGTAGTTGAPRTADTAGTADAPRAAGALPRTAGAAGTAHPADVTGAVQATDPAGAAGASGASGAASTANVAGR